METSACTLLCHPCILLIMPIKSYCIVIDSKHQVIYMYVHTRERDIRPGFDGIKIKFYYYYEK